MPTGIISKWRLDKGYGFIKQPTGGDLFFHLTDCQGFQPQVSMAVEFVTGPGKDGSSVAKQVKAVGAVAPVTGPTPPSVAAPQAFNLSSAVSGDLLIPREAARLAAPLLAQPAPLHPGLLLDRLPSRQHLTDQEHQKEHLDRVTKARPWNKDIYQATLLHLEGGIPPILCTARSRIALHLSRAGGLENANCCLHPVHGFPYLPGSGLKGLAAAYAGHLWQTEVRGKPIEEAFIREVEDIFGWAPNQLRNAHEPQEANPRSSRAGKRAEEQMRGAVVFHDAFGETATGEAPHLDVDVLTCHYPDYYMDGKPPGDWQSPQPVTFLTIAAGTRFRFRVTAASSATVPSLVEAAKRLLLGGLYWLGAGAKTAAGYGAFEDHFEESPAAKAQRLAAEAAQAQRTAGQALEVLWSQMLPTQALWVPKNANSSKGYRITRITDGGWQWEDGWEYSKNPQPASIDLVYLADVNPQVAKRLGNPRLQAGVRPPAGRGK